MNEKITKVEKHCHECGGEGDVSGCCSAEVDGGRCMSCGRFCHVDECHDCSGHGCLEFNVGDQVDIFVCAWTEQYLQDQLYKSKHVNDSKTFTGKIIDFVDEWNAIVKVGKKKINVKLDDLNIR